LIAGGDESVRGRREGIGTERADEFAPGLGVGQGIEPGPGIGESGVEVEAARFTHVTTVFPEMREFVEITCPQREVAFALDLQALPVPVGFEQRLAREEGPDLRRMHVHALIVPKRHDGQQRFQRWTGLGDAAVLEVAPRHPLLRFDDVVNAVREVGQVLGLRFEDGLGEDRARVVENLAHEVRDEAFGDAIAEPARLYALALEIEIVERFHVAVLDQPGGSALLRMQPRPDFRHQEADVVVHAHLGTDVASRG
jgi:hypothetical protein